MEELWPTLCHSTQNFDCATPKLSFFVSHSEVDLPVRVLGLSTQCFKFSCVFVILYYGLCSKFTLLVLIYPILSSVLV